MTLSQLRSLCRAMIPGSKGIDNATFDLIINEGVKDIAGYTLCLKSNKKFNVAAGQSEYVLSTVVGDFLTPDAAGLFWNNGTNWKQVYPRTLKYLDEFRPTWRNLGNGSPLDYSIDADILTISPPPETTLADGFWLYYAKQPVAMTEEGHFPFSGNNTELTHLSIFDFCIILFARMKLSPMLNKDEDANLSLQEYRQEREIKMNMFYRRRDITNSRDLRLQGPKVGG